MSKFVSIAVKVFVVFMFGMFLGMSLGCSKEKEPDPVALNSPISSAQQAALDRGKAEEAKYGYTPPKAGWDDSASYRYREAKNLASQTSMTVARWLALVVFHLLMLLIPFITIVTIPGLAVGKYEMTIEGGILILCGAVLLGANWIGELQMTQWVWACLIIPGVILFAVSWFVKEGAWKIFLVMGPPVAMVILGFFKLVDAYMSALMAGSALAVVGTIIGLWIMFSGDDEKASSH